MAKMTMKGFEKSKYDKEPKGMKEGSKADKVLDKKQFGALKTKAKAAKMPKAAPKMMFGKTKK